MNISHVTPSESQTCRQQSMYRPKLQATCCHQWYASLPAPLGNANPPSNNDLQLCPLACATCQWRLMCGNWSAISYLQNLLCETCLCTKHASIGMCFRCLFGESWSWSWCLMKFHPKHEQAHMMQKQLYIYIYVGNIQKFRKRITRKYNNIKKFGCTWPASLLRATTSFLLR